MKRFPFPSRSGPGREDTGDADVDAVRSREAAEAEPSGAPIHEAHLAPQLKAVLLAAALVATVLLFQALATLILLVLITVLIAIPLASFATFLSRFRIPRALGAFLGLAIGIGVLAELVNLMIPPVAKQLKELARTLPAVIEDLRVRYVDLVGGQADGGAAQLRGVIDRLLERPLTVIEPLLSFGIGVAGVIFTLVLILLTAYYVAVRPEPLLKGILNLFPPARRDWAVHLLARLRTAWVGWLRGVLADMFLSGLLLYIGLSVVGLEFALLFAVFSALLVVIPYFGSIIAGIPPILLALTDSPERALLVLVVYVAVQQIEGNLIIPLIMAQTVRLHPAVLAVGVVAVGALFGLVGLFVAVPILSTVQILIDELWIRPAERADARRRAEPAEPLPQPEATAEVPSSGPEATIFKRPTEAPATPGGEGPGSA